MNNLEYYSFEIPASFEHIVVLEEKNHSFKYTAQAWGLYFDGAEDIRGGALLYKEELITETVPVTRIKVCKSWWPFQRVITTVTRTKQRVVWRFQTPYNHCYYLFNGGLKGNNSKGGCRNEIKGLAANKGVVLTNELLDLAFDPIDAKIKELYETVKRLSSGQHMTNGNGPFKVHGA